MENKKYLDKILGFLKKGVSIEGNYFFLPYNKNNYYFNQRGNIEPFGIHDGYYEYLSNNFGLTNTESDSLWGEFLVFLYKDILEKIKNKE